MIMIMMIMIMIIMMMIIITTTTTTIMIIVTMHLFPIVFGVMQISACRACMLKITNTSMAKLIMSISNYTYTYQFSQMLTKRHFRLPYRPGTASFVYHFFHIHVCYMFM